MSTQWFANRGQIIQVIITAIACAIAAIVNWPSIVAHSLTVGPFVFYALLAITVGLVVRTVLNALPRPSIPVPSSAPAPASLHTAQSAPVPVEQKELSMDRFDYSKHTIPLGSYVEVKEGLTTIKVTPLEIKTLSLKRSYGEESVDAVELKVSRGGGMIHGGDDTKRVGINQFLVPVSSNPYQGEESSLYSFAFNENHIGFTGIRVDHLNKHAREVEISVAYATRSKITI